MSYYFTSATLFEADGETVKAVLSNAYSKTWLDERDGDGSFEVSLPYEDSLIARPGDIVKLSYGLTSNSYVFAGIVENISYNLAGSNGGEDREARIGGRGIRVLLANAVVYPVGISGKRSFYDDTAGKIMRDLVEEAQARGTLTELTLGFSDTNDSNGSPFSKTISIDESVGTSLLEVANRHVELAVDVYISPNLELRYYNNRGTDTTATLTPVTFRIGDTVSELSKEYSGPVLNTILVEYGNKKYKTENDVESVSTYGRRETFLSVPNVTTETQVARSTEQLLATTASPNEGITLSLEATELRPYEDYNIGDYVYVIDHTGVRTKYRISSLSISEDEAGNVSIVPELGTLRSDLTRRLNRALARLEASNAYGNSINSSLVSSVTTGGEIVLLPGGVIQPAVINVPAGYPMNLTEILGEVGQYLSPELVRWDVRDLTEIGYFSRTLVVADGFYGPSVTRFYNLDNMSQAISVPSINPFSAGAFKIINGTYYNFFRGVQRWTGSSWATVILGNANRPWQVGTTWYVIGRRPEIDAQDSLWAFDETTEIASQVGDFLSYAGVTHSIVGNGYAWIVSNGVPAWLDLSAPTTWNYLYSTGFSVTPGVEVGMDVDGNLISFFIANNNYIYVLDRTGVVSITTNPLGFIEEITQAGGSAGVMTNNGSYVPFGISLGTRSGWTLASVLYRTAENPLLDLGAIFAVGPYGYTPVVYSEDPIYRMGGRSYPWGVAGFEQLNWSPDSNEGVMRGALLIANDNAPPGALYNNGYHAFEWSVPVITP